MFFPHPDCGLKMTQQAPYFLMLSPWCIIWLGSNNLKLLNSIALSHTIISKDFTCKIALGAFNVIIGGGDWLFD